MSTALVTGASSGIGRSFAEQLTAQGWDVVLVARREERLREIGAGLEAAHRVRAEVLAVDLASEDGIRRVEERIANGAPLDLVINNAGFAARGPVAEFDLAAFEEMVKVNVLALARLSRAALKRMMAARQGAIVNVASGTVFMQMPGNAGYGSTKNFVMAFTRHMQAEARDSGVQVQLLIPGVIATDFHEVAGADIGRFPPERVMQASELVAACLRGLSLGEPVCIPSLPEIADWQAYAAAETALVPNVSRDRVAGRYR